MSPSREVRLHQLTFPKMEDVAIAYGFNDMPRSSPNKSVTIGKPLMINKLSDIVRHECAMAGWAEVMPLILCSHEENFEWLNRKDDGTTAVKLANPKTVEYQVVRTSLLPGLLKTLSENKAMRLPLEIFESADVVFKDEASERRARNERRWAAAYYGKTSGFEIVHGLLDRVMTMLRVAFITHEEGLAGKSIDFEVKENPSQQDGYFIQEIDEPTFFNGRAAAIYVRLGGKLQRIGELGVLHPTVLEKFDLRYDGHPYVFRTELSMLIQLQIPGQHTGDQPRGVPLSCVCRHRSRSGRIASCTKNRARLTHGDGFAAAKPTLFDFKLISAQRPTDIEISSQLGV